MELSNRKQQILAAIIQRYIETGEPVGSKLLCSVLGSNLSSATLRNEMSDLCEMGYLKQPHTSAGRTPTSDGIRFYISRLMPTISTDSDLCSDISRTLSALPNEAGDLLPRCAGVLSELTGMPAFSAMIPDRSIKIAAASATRVWDNLIMLSVMTSVGISGNKVCKTIWQLSDEQISRFNNVVKQFIIGRPLSEFTAAAMQTISMAAGANGLALSPLFNDLFQYLNQLCTPALSVKGISKFHDTAGSENAQQLLEFATCENRMISLIDRANAPVTVILGDESDIPALHSSGIVVANYRVGSSRCGKVGVIGPIRMNYQRLIPEIEYFAAEIGKKLSAVFESED